MHLEENQGIVLRFEDNRAKLREERRQAEMVNAMQNSHLVLGTAGELKHTHSDSC